MGYPMAQNISKFYKLKAYNRSYVKSKNLKSYNIYVCRTIKQVCENCDFLITMLPGDKEVLNISKKIIITYEKKLNYHRYEFNKGYDCTKGLYFIKKK